MLIGCFSDSHGLHNQLIIPKVDVLICAGDALSSGSLKEFMSFAIWFGSQKAKYKLYTPGNHCRVVESQTQLCKQELANRDITLLIDQFITIEDKVFYGFPWTPPFYNWAFMKTEEELARKLVNIPDNVDVLISHGPPYGILDYVPRNHTNAGSYALADYLANKQVLNAKMTLLCGHLHFNGGMNKKIKDIDCYNVAVCDENYRIANQPRVLDI